MPYHVYVKPIELWALHVPQRAQCGGIYGKTVEVADQAACQAMAVEAGHDYYTYMSLPHTNQCVTHADCEVRNASMPYHVYVKPIELWALHVPQRAQCGGIYGKTVEVADQAACQAMAIEAGHDYYTYMSLPHTNQCVTHADCDLRNASMPYHVHAQPVQVAMLQTDVVKDVVEQPVLWGQHVPQRAQCGGIYGKTVEVADQAACQAMAVEAGHD